MKKILYIADVFPYPTISGGKIRTYNLLKIISENNKVDFMCLSDEKVDNDYRLHVEKICRSVDIFNNAIKNKFKRLMNFISLKSDKIFLNYSKDLDEKLSLMLKKNKYDIIFIDSLFLYKYIIKKNIDRSNCRIILDIHNVENEILYRTMKEARGIIVKIYSLMEHYNIKRFERFSIKDSDLSIVVSERDKKKYLEQINVSYDKICVIENGFNCNVNTSCLNLDSNEKYLLFVGSLWYRPNYDGLDWFIENVWDDMLKIYPNFKLKIIGKYRNEDKKIEKKNIEYLGFVDDLSSFYNNCFASIVPLFIGSGTRLKILEAFSYRCPVISTDIGCEGLDVSNKEDILIANNKEEFIKSIEILNNSEEQQKLVNNAYNLIKKKYDWSVIREKLKKTLADY